DDDRRRYPLDEEKRIELRRCRRRPPAREDQRGNGGEAMSTTIHAVGSSSHYCKLPVAVFIFMLVSALPGVCTAALRARWFNSSWPRCAIWPRSISVPDVRATVTSMTFRVPEGPIATACSVSVP